MATATARYDTAVYDTAVYDGATGTPLVELLLGATWTDITTYVRIEQGITIQRGRADWSQSPTYATCSLTLDNRDGRFSPRNASGAFYGLIGRNTQVRVSAFLDDGSTSIRFWGDVSEWPVSWDTSGRNVWVNIQASGLRRALQKNAVALRSAWYRKVTTSATVPVAYWPMEEGTQATTFSPYTTGVNPMTVAGTIAYASDDTFVASAPLPVLSGVTGLTAVVPSFTPSATGQQVRFFFHCEDTAADGVSVYIRTSGAHYFLFQYQPSTGNAAIAMVNNATDAVESTGFGTFVQPEFKTQWVRFSIELRQNGTGVDMNVVWYQPGADAGRNFGIFTVPSATLGVITAVQIANTGAGVSTTVGHLTVENTITSIFTDAAAAGGWNGELANARATRLAAEQGVTASVQAATFGSCEAMGVQGISTFLDLFDQCAYTEDGISTEDVATRSLRFRSRSGLYDQTAVQTLSFTANEIRNLQPVDDDQLLENDVTVNRINGATATYMVTTGTQAIATVGDYQQAYDLSLGADSQALPQAQWRATAGTVDAPRWPVVQTDANRLASAGRRTTLASIREGDVINVTDLPAYTGATSPVVTVLGWTEEITDVEWIFTFNCAPADVWQSVMKLDDGFYGTLDTNRLAL